jgi:copper chaperone CopZ
MKVFVVPALFVVPLAVSAVARGEELTHATFTITGLHCPPCTRTVQSSLAKTPGVKSATVDWKSKSARLAFDEQKISAQRLARRIAATPHMMGAGMRYGGQLALSVPGLKDDATAQAARQALSKIAGVAGVATFPGQHSLTVQFTADGDVSSRQLIDALAQAGIKASTY